ncbi:MAG: hypothetical protein AAFP16_00735 [Pseudomonadota bacterium]
MPEITKASVQNYGPANSRLEFQIKVELDNDPTDTRTFGFNVSDNKHCAGSYKDGGSTPSAAPVGTPNTLVNMSKSDFSGAFHAYARSMAAKLKGKDADTFDPSAHNVAVKEIAFTSDVARLGADVHCFPVLVGPVATPKCVELDFDEFNDFKTTTAFLYMNAAGNLSAQKSNARDAWDSIKARMTALVGADNELLTETEVNTLNVRLAQAAVAAGVKPVEQLAKEDHSAQMKAIHKRVPTIPGAKPFRGTG